MPTTITSAGITFNDATTLTSANIGTAQLVNGSVTADKLGTNEQRQIAKAWVNFNGSAIGSSFNAGSNNTISCNSGATIGTWVGSGWEASNVGVIYKITQINGVSGGTLGGVNVSTLGVQIISVESSTSATFRFLSGTTTSAQSVTGTGSSASGFSYSTSGIRSSYNVSSITKNGTGIYTVNFTTAMADANYAIVGGAWDTGGYHNSVTGTSNKTATQCSVDIHWRAGGASNSTYVDSPQTSVIVFGN